VAKASELIEEEGLAKEKFSHRRVDPRPLPRVAREVRAMPPAERTAVPPLHRRLTALDGSTPSPRSLRTVLRIKDMHLRLHLVEP